MSLKKRKNFLEATPELHAAAEATSEHRVAFGGFSTAKKVMQEVNSALDVAGVQRATASNDINAASTEGTKSFSSTTNKSDPADFLQNLLTIHLTVRGIKHYKENIRSLDAITLHREPHNSHDENAICAKNGESNVVGHVAKEQASILAKPMDENINSLENVCLKEQKDTTLTIAAKVNLLDEDQMEQFKFQILPKIFSTQTNTFEKPNLDMINDEEVRRLAKGIIARDTKTALTCPFDILKLHSLPWRNKLDGGEMSTTWPPSQDILDKFGHGIVDDEQWWQENTGLKPQSMWNVTGALDLLPRISLPSHHKTLARDALDGAVHGVTNVWSDATLLEIRDLMQSPNFWCYRSSDSFIKAYGGPYVLGQKEGKLKLVKGAPQTPLTEKVCRGHNVVYELVHMTKPPEPGFNTLIFGLNLRGSGFHYHQDTITSLKAKNGEST
ncbi:hypothetical protein ACHAW5_005363 [Stephanodiscus triporus]|uniref:HIRAN domain-containing protein n=1 Tax=Stephanodiscus triporus TaxID=2934178 RepID=A0ABD3PE77_9STRA